MRTPEGNESADRPPLPVPAGIPHPHTTSQGAAMSGYGMAISESRLAEIRARLGAATPGPWSRFVDEWRPTAPLSVHRIGGGDEDIANVYLTRPADADLIAHAPADLADLLAEVERLRDERRGIVSGIYECPANEPQPGAETLLEWVASDYASAREHEECPSICESCGERSADRACEHCNGSGCGPDTALGAYSECEWCAGAGRVHPGCTGMSHADLLADRDRLAAENAALRKVAEAADAMEQVRTEPGHWHADRTHRHVDATVAFRSAVREWRAER